MVEVVSSGPYSRPWSLDSLCFELILQRRKALQPLLSHSRLPSKRHPSTVKSTASRAIHYRDLRDDSTTPSSAQLHSVSRTRLLSNPHPTPFPLPFTAHASYLSIRIPCAPSVCILHRKSTPYLAIRSIVPSGYAVPPAAIDISVFNL